MIVKFQSDTQDPAQIMLNEDEQAKEENSFGGDSNLFCPLLDFCSDVQLDRYISLSTADSKTLKQSMSMEKVVNPV